MRIKTEAIAAYGGKCVCCSETTPEFLSIDHINGRSGRHARRGPHRIGNMWEWLRSHGYPKDEYRLLCHNCNLGRFINGGVCPHQSGPRPPVLHIRLIGEVP